MNLNRIISTMLVAVMAFGTLVGILPTFSVVSYANDKIVLDPTVDGGAVAQSVLYQTYLSAQDKINTDPYMYKYAETNSYILYCNPYSGEVYTKDKVTGQILTTNPYYIGDTYSTDTIPRELMSQFELLFTKKDGSEVVYNSYDWASSRGQIFATQTKTGVRLEYTVGDTSARYLVPNGISRERFETLILIPAQQYLISTIQEMILEKRGPLDASSTEEDIKYENDEELAAFCAWAEEKGYYPIHNKRRVNWNFDDVMAYFESFDPEESRALGENIVETFDDWYRLAYVYYKVLCGNNGKNYKEYSKMGNATADYFSLTTMYQLQDPNDVLDKPGLLKDMQDTYPATKKQDEDGRYFALYALDSSLSNAKKRGLQDTIAKYAPEYTIDMMYEDEAETELEPVIEINPVFRLAIEYALSDTGMTVTLPANSIFYDESLYTLTGIEMLRYMGSDNMNRGGYLFYPDGSGTLVDFDEFANKNITLSGNVFGQDYSFHTLSGAKSQAIRMPVYGAVTDKTVYYFDDVYQVGQIMYISEETYQSGQFVYTIKEKRFDETAEDGETVISHYEFFYETDGGEIVWLKYEDEEGENYGKQYFIDANKERIYFNAARGLSGREYTYVVPQSQFKTNSFTDGFLAILEDGASLCKMNVEINGASNNPYAAIFPTFKPLAQDKYDLSEVNTSADSVMFTVSSKEKYMDDMVIRYVILADESVAESASRYEASYVGMADAYRAYLTDAAQGVLSMTNEEVMSQLPLYIETFGVMETIEKILTIPVEVNVPLTSFEDIQTMYKELSDAGIKNVKFRLTGYANGGMDSTYPVKLRWERKAGGKSGFRNLVNYVSSHVEEGLQIFPNFEMQYIENVGLFDGIRWRKIAARSVDNRYAMKRIYSPYLQENDSELVGTIVAPTMITKLFDKLDRRYAKYKVDTISLGTVAGELNSSYDEDEIILREDALAEMQSFLAKVAGKYEVMSSGGNTYALKYITHLLEAPIDSSHFRATSYTIPFFGMVMHGAISYTGNPLNEDGNPSYTILRSLESGAALYFILSYQNTELMKEDENLSRYYSVNYKIWKEDVVSYYNKLNDAIGQLQDYVIKNHEFLTAERWVSDEKLKADRQKMEEEYLTSLRQYASSALSSANADLAVLREFYNESIDKMIKNQIDAEKEIMKYKGQAIPEDYTQKRTVELSEQYRGNEKYEAYLGWLSTNRFEMKRVLLPYVKTLTDNGSQLFARLFYPENVTHETATYDQKADALMNAILGDSKNDNKKTVLLLDGDVVTGQTIGLTMNYATLLNEALVAFGVDPEGDWATNADMQDVQDFAVALEALCEDMHIDAHVNPAYADGLYEINVDLLHYEPQNRYITNSIATDGKDYVRTVYTVGDGSVSIVSYVKGDHVVRFIVNYNMFDIVVTLEEGGEKIPVAAQDFTLVKD